MMKMYTSKSISILCYLYVWYLTELGCKDFVSAALTLMIERCRIAEHRKTISAKASPHGATHSWGV